MAIPPYSPAYSTKSLYASTSINGRFMSFYLHRQINPDYRDTVEIVKQEYHLRPDLFALDHYGDEQLFWVVPVRNGLQDLLFDFRVGLRVFVPSLDRVKELV